MTFKSLKELYENQIDRPFNPAVNAGSLDDETVNTEIDEYVFTDEIIKSMTDVLQAIRDKNLSHNGIWINGYFGSGKSHFLKYLDYCLTEKWGQKALERLKEAVKERDPLQNPDSKCEVTIAEVNELLSWYKRAQVETILFNIGSVANSNTNEQKVFTEVFWHELNRHRGYNTFNLSLAQYLEKKLDEEGKFEEFKKKLSDEYHWDWMLKASQLANTELDTVLDVAKEVLPSLSTDAIRERVIKNDYPLSVEAFVNELQEYVSTKPDNFRLVFFADEISQFIDSRKGLLLQLQQIVSDINEPCKGKVWIACTAQQDLSEIVGECKINSTDETYGKIMGRFQVKVSLKGTNPEYITQKRILDKKGSATIELEQMYDRIKNNITAQLVLPTGYTTFTDRKEFAAYYPFVPYQFTLMMAIFDAFTTLGYVDKEVKGNERSIIKITYSVANDTKDEPVGNVISFDQFFNAMFSGSLTAKGQKALRPALDVINTYHDKNLGPRVANILYMLCNMHEDSKSRFPATTENVTVLLMRDMDENKQKLKSDVQGAIDHLVKNNVLRREKLSDGTEFYDFYTEEERRVADSIKGQPVDNTSMATELEEIFKEFLAGGSQGMNNREQYYTAKLSVGGTVNDKTFYNGNNADIVVDFVMEDDRDANTYAFQNGMKPNHLAFFMSDSYKTNEELRNRLYWICQVKRYLNSPEAKAGSSEQRTAALNKFREIMRKEYTDFVKPELQKLFNQATVISADTTFSIPASTKDKDRFREAMNRHLDHVYYNARMVKGDTVPKTETELKEKIKRAVKPGEYENIPMSAPETEILNHLNVKGIPVNAKDILTYFSNIPYGWSSESTLYFLNELIRRNEKMLTMNGQENPDRNEVANHILRESSKFMVHPVKAISTSLINDFVQAWRDVLGDAHIPASNNPIEIHQYAKDTLNGKIGVMQDVMAKVGSYPVAKRVQPAIEMAKEWAAIRDDEQFFKKVIADKDTAKKLMDDEKQIRQFAEDRTLDAYKSFIEFVNLNRENWEHLPDSSQPDIEAIKAITTEEWPVDKLASYKKIQRTLNAELDNVRNTLRDNIKRKLYDEGKKLEQFAAESGVEYEPNLTNEVYRQTVSNNIGTLKNNEESNKWYTDQIAIINSRIPGPGPNPGNGGTGGAGPQPPKTVKKIKKVKLNTPTLHNLKSLEDIDKYLDGLRTQLISKLGDADEIQVV